jgi:ElaB/YqjD/DUF883 family membrane-anchored ribosome-binding protein
MGPDHTVHADNIGRRARDEADHAADQVRGAAGNVQEAAERIAMQAREYGDKAMQAARGFKPFVEGSMREQPISSLIAAAAIGFALGALWKK